MKQIRLALVGASGGIAETHLGAIAKCPEIKIVGMCDVVGSPMRDRAVGVGCRTFTDWKVMLKAVEPDLVSIATPHPFHPLVAVDAMRAGAHVLTEKPMAVEVRDADRMVAVSKATRRILAVNYQMRFRAVAEEMKRRIDAGELGQLIRVLVVEPWYRSDAYYRSATWRGKWGSEGGGVLMNQAPHTQDLLCWLAGSPAKVWGWVRTRFHPMECEDSAQAMLEYPNGAPGYITVSTVEPGSQGCIQIIGERSGFQLDRNGLFRISFTPSILRHMRTAKGMWDQPKSEMEPVQVPKGGTGLHIDVYRNLIRAIRRHGQPRCNAAEGRKSLELANAIVLSSVTGRPVTLPVNRAAYSTVLKKLRARKRL
ncbi:MAG: Gfo/Idh/MocA family oxidoreductase [Candidatus Coatesbacteria bacterium]